MTIHHDSKRNSPMRKNLALAVLACLALLAAPARADEEVKLAKDFSMTVGYKLWLNTWETAIPSYSNGGNHVNAITAGPVAASIPNLSFKYKRFLLSGSYMFTPDYKFPAFRDTFVQGGVGFTTADRVFTASRKESDINLGYYFTPNLVATVGYKNVEQKYQEKIGNTTLAATKTHYNGVTAGIGGSAGIGAGFALYGNAAGGLMQASYTPSSSHDTALYEASEVGLAWHHEGFGANLGYKFQYLTTRNPGIVAADVSRGYMFGMSYTF